MVIGWVSNFWQEGFASSFTWGIPEHCICLRNAIFEKPSLLLKFLFSLVLGETLPAKHSHPKVCIVEIL